MLGWIASKVFRYSDDRGTWQDRYEYDCANQDDYRRLMESTVRFREDIASCEDDMSRGRKHFTISGYCEICKAQSTFTANYRHSWLENGRRVLNWREHLRCRRCGLNNRMRAALKRLVDFSPVGQVYLTEQSTPLFAAASRHLPRLHGSEFLRDGTPSGATNKAGMRHEDVTCLTFARGSFDCIGTFDVLEHVPQYECAISEFYRCLRPAGHLLTSIPFHLDFEATVTRAVVQLDGSIKHLLPPEIHGDPLDPAGVLCFHDFGWSFFEVLTQAGFRDAKMLFYWSKRFAYLGGLQFLIHARKPG